ncbi:MAG: 2-C-methyl-D-erythritol 4-phosphate cytidylyltransferase [Oscillospiraceae bacterium]|nr:2-C-methyl-D-erythritol 4-phosphate cytidylyltransferase [Oscillospiraceae bacterium]
MAFSKKKKEPPFVSAVIVAAGLGKRMNGMDTQLEPLDGMPVIAHSIGAFSGCPLISEIVVVCREDQTLDIYDLIRFYELEKVTGVVTGGENRQDSVFLGVRACSEKAAFYAIHDGARPLILPQDIEECLYTALETGAAATGVPVKDTVKVIGKDATVISTPDRHNLWAVQTPQIFKAGIYKRAMEISERDKCAYADDCRLVERAGYPVTMVEGGDGNVTITTLEDLAVAHAILEFRLNGGLLP